MISAQQIAGLVSSLTAATVSAIQTASKQADSSEDHRTVVVPVVVVLITGNMFSGEREMEFGGSAAIEGEKA